MDEGNATGPYRDYLFYWKTTRKDGIDRVATLLWPYLSAEKRTQFELMTRAANREIPVFAHVPRDTTAEP